MKKRIRASFFLIILCILFISYDFWDKWSYLGQFLASAYSQNKCVMIWTFFYMFVAVDGKNLKVNGVCFFFQKEHETFDTIY